MNSLWSLLVAETFSKQYLRLEIEYTDPGPPTAGHNQEE